VPARQEQFNGKMVGITDGDTISVLRDGNGNVVFRKALDYTDFPLEEITLYFTDRVILLPSEY
jgi:hypothetical protein